MNTYISKLHILTLIFTIFISLHGFGQTIGDYRSTVTGNWTTLTSWQRYNGTTWTTPTVGEGYPGQFTGTGAVTIQASNIITISSSGITTQPMGTIRINNTGQLYLTGSGTMVSFSLNTMEFYINSGGSIYFQNKSKIVLPTNGVIYLGTNSIIGDCNNNNQIWIGSSEYAVCAGAPGNIFTYAQIMDATSGGTLNAIVTSNSPICEGGTINLTGNYSGAIGTAPTYSWSVTAPGGSVTSYSTQSVSISPAIVGTYTATLTVTTVLLGMPYTNAETKSIIVNQLPTLTGASQAFTVCDGSSATINLSGLNPNTTFTIDYSINGISQTAISGLTSNASGTSSFSTPVLTQANNGQTLQIIKITNTSTCQQNFTQNVTLSVWQTGSWIGITSSDWNTASNWCGGIPTTSTDAFILATATNQPIINAANGVCKNLTINAGASVTINSGGALTVNENITNNGTIAIKSSASGDGSLISNSNVSGSGNYTVERYLSGNKWHLVTSPITNAFSGVFLDIWLRPYVEANNAFGAYIVPTTIPMPTGQGFSVWANSDETRTFTGTINNGTIGLISLSKSNLGWNLIGNPYPSSIDWQASSGWTKTNIADAVYIWNNGQYATFIGGIATNGGSRYISMGQGFFVQATGTGASITMNNNVRVHNPISYKSENAVPNQIRLAVQGNNYSDETVLYEAPEALHIFDFNYDAAKIYGVYRAPQLYTKKGNEKTAIHAVSNMEIIHNDSLYLEVGDSAEYTIQFYQNADYETNFVLVDLLTQSIIPANYNYNFTAQPSDNPARFKFQQLTDNSKNEIFYTENTIFVYSKQKVLYINTNNNIQLVELYNLNGQKILETQETAIQIDYLQTGFYIVKVQTNNEIKFFKIFNQ